MLRPVPTLQEVIDQINSGRTWDGPIITFSFPTSASGMSANDGEAPGFTAMLPAGQQAVRLAIAMWDDLIVADFREIAPGTNPVTSNLEFGMSTTGIEFAHAYFPTDGSVWFNSTNNAAGSDNNLVAPIIGRHGFLTYVHEIGHALGMNHSGEYNGTGNWTAMNQQDSTVYTVMSYFGPNWDRGEGEVAWANWLGTGGVVYSPQTPMLNDIFVVQRMYGAETTTRTDNTTYGFNSTVTGILAEIYDFARNRNPILTIYDSGGIDTLDVSGWSSSSLIDIGQGRFSSVNNMTNNIAIAFGSNIENARGGSGADKIFGNTLANLLSGGAGNDQLFGLGGDDTLFGGDGNDELSAEAGNSVIYGGLGTDTAVFSLARSAYQITAFQNFLTVRSSSGTLTIHEAEQLRFSDGTVAVSSIAVSSDTSAPTVLTFSPGDGATGVAVGTNIVLTFSEIVAFGSGTITLRAGSASGTIVESFDAATSTRLALSGERLTIDPTNNLSAGTQYFVTLPAGSFKDLAGNNYSGTTSYDFTTQAAADTTAPTVSTFSPADGATGVAVSSNVVVTFSEAIARGEGTITLRAGSASGTIVESFDAATSERLVVSGATLTIDPTSNLAAGTQYFLTFSSGAIKDIAGNAFSGTTSYDFTTATAAQADDFPNSTATTGIVTVGGAAITGTIERTGDFDLFKVTLTGGASYIFNLNAISRTLNPQLRLYDSNLTQVAVNNDFGTSQNSQINFTAPSSGTYYLQAGDFSTGTGSYSIQAAKPDTTAPTVLSFAPKDGATGVAIGSNIIVTFSEAVARGTGTITLRTGSASGTVVESYDAATSGRLQFIGSVLTIDPSSDLLPGSQYFLTFSPSAVRDLAGNFYAGTSTYDFTTASSALADDFPNTTATTGVVTVGGAATSGSIETAGDRDLFRITLAAGTTYTFNLNATSGALDPYLRLFDASLTELAVNDDFGSSRNSQITFTATSSGTYYLQARDFDTGTGKYNLLASASTNVVDDFPNAVTTTGVVNIGGSASAGSIESSGDQDAFRVTLTAGVTYIFNLNATSESLDPYLRLFDANLTEVAFNDDFGSSRNSQITFTPTSSGTYYLQAKDFDKGTGTYTISGQAMAAPTDDFPNSPSTTGVVTVGGAATVGSIERSGDLDGFRITLVAGTRYIFSLSATSASLDPYLRLFDSSLTELASNDDFGVSRNSVIAFTPTTSGTYFLQAGDFDTGTGAYALQATLADAIAPTVVAFSPADGATNVATNSNVIVTFSEAVTAGAGVVEIRVGSPTGPVFESYDLETTDRISVLSATTAQIDPLNVFAAGTQYFVVIPAGIVIDAAGNSYAGTTTYDFTTATPANLRVAGTAANDQLTGSGRNEDFDGGNGLDTAIFTGARQSYDISRVGEVVTVRDLRSGGDGTDTLVGVERLQFADGLMGLVPERLVVLLPSTRDLLSWDSTLGSQGFGYLARLGADISIGAVADLTGDGRADLLLQQPGGGLIRWDLSQGGNGFNTLAAAPGFSAAGTGDLVGNSTTDVLLRNAAGQLRILDPATNTISDLFTLAQGWSLKGVANINGSGKADIVIQNDTSGAIIAFTDQGWRDLITLSPASGWQIGGLGDVVGGLADDFVFRNPTTGVTIFWDATQGGQGFRDFATIAQGWNLLTISDLSGDGRDDVVFQNANGLTVYWSGTNWVDLGSTLAGAQLQGTGLFA